MQSPCSGHRVAIRRPLCGQESGNRSRWDVLRFALMTLKEQCCSWPFCSVSTMRYVLLALHNTTSAISLLRWKKSLWSLLNSPCLDPARLFEGSGSLFGTILEPPGYLDGAATLNFRGAMSRAEPMSRPEMRRSAGSDLTPFTGAWQAVIGMSTPEGLPGVEISARGIWSWKTPLVQRRTDDKPVERPGCQTSGIGEWLRFPGGFQRKHCFCSH